MMPLVSLVLLAAWTVILIRVASVRATLSARTFWVYLVLGAFLGTVGVPLFVRFFDPYQIYSANLNFSLLTALGVQVLLLAPLSILFSRRIFQATSIADSFLVAFAIGFGFDLAVVLLAATTASQPLRGLSLFPPWQFSNGTVTMAGYGYWTALVALARAGTLRFIRKPLVSAIVTGVVLLWATADAVVAREAAISAPQVGLLSFLGLITMHGALTAWIVLGGAIGLSIWETLWIKRDLSSGAPPRHQLMNEVRTLLGAILHGRIREFCRLSTFYRLRRQISIARAQLVQEKQDRQLQRMVRELEEQMQQAQTELIAPAKTKGNIRALQFLQAARFQSAIGWVALACLLLVVPQLPEAMSNSIWSYLNLQIQVLTLSVPLLNTILMVVLLWRYVVAAGGAGPKADDAVQFEAERILLNMCLGVILLVILYADLPTFYPFPSLLAYCLGALLPEISAPHFVTLLLLFATAVSGLALPHALQWRAAPPNERRRTVLRNLSNAVTAFLLALVCFAVYTPGLTMLHLYQGEWIQKKFMDGDGPSTATALAAEMTVLIAGVTLFLAWFLDRGSRRVEIFFVGDASAEKETP